MLLVLACLCTISKLLWAEFSSGKASRTSVVLLKVEPTLSGCIQAAQKRIGLWKPKGFWRAGVEALAELEGPAILHVVRIKNREHYLFIFFGLADGKHG